MNDENLKLIWQKLEQRRGRGMSRSEDELASIIKEVRAASGEFGLDELQHVIKLLGPNSPLFSVPSFLPQFIGFCHQTRASSLPIRRILDPWARTGQLLIPLTEIVNPDVAVGLQINQEEQEIAALLTPEGISIEWLLQEPLEMLSDQALTPFDLIVSLPPLGYRRVINHQLESQVKDFFGNLILLYASRHLSEQGQGYFVTTPSFWPARINPASVAAQLKTHGLFISAILSIPAGSFLPTASVEASLVVVQKTEEESLFVGELSSDANWNFQLSHNLRNRKAGSELGLGALVAPGDFSTYANWRSAFKRELMAGSLNMTAVALPDVATALRLASIGDAVGFEDVPNTVYLPKTGRGPALASLSELTSGSQNYVQIVLDEEKAVASYVAGFFGTPLGQMCREAALSGINAPRISKASLEKLVLYLPDLLTQLKTVEVDTEINNRSNELTELKNSLWSKPKQIQKIIKALQPAPEAPREARFQDWLGSLPFPLASILWTYHASGEDHKSRYEHLIHFFEALAMFHAAVLLSGFRTDPIRFEAERESMRETLRGDRMEASTFGVWVKFVARLAKQGRALWNGSEEEKRQVQRMFCTSRWDVLDMLFAKELLGVLQDTNSLRNKWLGHSGVVSEKTAHERRTELERHLSRVRRVFGETWSTYRLIKPLDTKVVKGAFHFQVEQLLGNQTPFEKISVITSTPMEDNELYLLGADETRPLPVLPIFKVMPSPETALNACYFYNRVEPKGMRFVSYHFEQEADITAVFPDTMKALQVIWPQTNP